MKKTIIGVFGGVTLGVLLIFLVFYILSRQAVSGDGNEPGSSSQIESEIQSETESETITETEIPSETETETEIPTETELPTETETETETESESESESEPESQKPTKPKNIPYYIKVNRQANCVTIYAKDDNGNYTVPIKSMICSVGLNNRTPLGTYTISDKYIWRMLFGDEQNVYGQYAVRIVGHILFHSVPYTATSKDKLLEGQFNMLGEPASKGCIRLAAADVKWIYDNCVAGTTVEIYDSPFAGPLGRPEGIKVSENSPFKGWDPTDPDAANPWNTGSVLMTGMKDLTVERGTTPDLVSHVSATDVDGLPISVSVATELDVQKAGKYPVVYTATGVTGKTTTATVTVTVVDTVAPTISQSSVVTVNNHTENVEAFIKAALAAKDGNDSLSSSEITLNISKLTEAMANEAYGKVYCEAYATDLSGNKSNVIQVEVVYEEIIPEETESETETETTEPEEPTEPETSTESEIPTESEVSTEQK